MSPRTVSNPRSRKTRPGQVPVRAIEPLVVVEAPVADPEVPQQPDVPVVVDSVEVDGLLRASMAAHLEYRQAAQRRDMAGIMAAIEEAARQRVLAHAADPDHTSPAWQAEQVNTPTGADTHDALSRFYRSKLKKVGG